MAILGGGSRNTKLQKLAMEIFLSLSDFNIKLLPVWVSRDSEIIQWADSGSRDPVSFELLKATFGVFTVDSMANSANSVCEKFYSRFSSVGSSAVNFFAQTLNMVDFFYCFPPVKQSVNALVHNIVFLHPYVHLSS